MIETEWFLAAAQVNSTINTLEEFLTNLETTAYEVFRKAVNMTDSNVRSKKYHIFKAKKILALFCAMLH